MTSITDRTSLIGSQEDVMPDFGSIQRRRPEPPRAPFGGPNQGARLVRAFTSIADPALRNAVIAFVEKLARIA